MATKDAVTKLINNGHKQIAFISGSLQQAINQNYRLQGYKAALEEAGIAFDEALVFETQYTYNAGFELANELYGTDATAAFVGADELAAGILNGLTDRGVDVPNDFEIITSINTKLTQITRPQLTSISIPMYDMGAVAMRMLTKLMGKENIENGRLSLPYGIISRQTTR